ncbi:glycosyltransferase [Rhizobium sp. FY34]|uniref:glycosyltransferase n=1 Tax=Rhizobium sp. FY34 TaxID=2562309 RepID=UPI00148541B7|nr:glycosyltransferase [Rhizobium sp. FY34]
MFHRPGKPPIMIEGDNVEYVELDEHPVVFYEAMGRHCETIGADAIIRTYPQEQHPAFPMTRQIFVIPDIQHEFYPNFFSDRVLSARRRAFAYALSCGGAIATMTGHSRATMVENGWTRTDDVFLMPAALPEELRETPEPGDLPAEAAKFDRFFYMPANMWAHKNHRRLFEAFKRAYPDLPPNTGLILSGNPEGFADFIKGYEDLPILHLGFVPHRQVAALFANATALVYFSLFEGFGMPLLEAFHHGTPVLCSNTTSLPEVGGDAVLACDPTDEAAMAALMKRITTEAGLRDMLSEKAKLRVLAYDWEGPARALRAAVTRVAGNPAEYPQRQPLVSIVMPTRNHARFIREAIDSVLNQSYPNIELLVMDGVSTDNTVEILKSYGDRIRWISEPDKGQTDAINKGTALLKGDVLAYLNSDDVLLPGAIETVVRYFNDHPECDMMYGNADYIDVDGHVTGTYNTAEYSFDRLMADCCICQPAAFWQRRIVDRIGPFDVSMQTAMDYEYWLRMARSGAIIHHVGDKLAQSRLHEDAKTLAMRGKIYEEVFEICERHGGYVSFSYYLGMWSYRLYESWSGGDRLRRIAPGIYTLPALVHFASQLSKIGADPEKANYVAHTVFGVVDRKSPFLGRAVRKAWTLSPALRRRFR